MITTQLAYNSLTADTICDLERHVVVSSSKTLFKIAKYLAIQTIHDETKTPSFVLIDLLTEESASYMLANARVFSSMDALLGTLFKDIPINVASALMYLLAD